MNINRRAIFQAVRQLRSGQGFTPDEVRLLDAAIDEAISSSSEPPTLPSSPPTSPSKPPTGRRVGPKGIALMHEFEGCRLTAYPDPGSRDGNPWTIGWGTTGPDIKLGVVWTQEQADQRFEADLATFAADVERLIGSAPTNQNQFDAMCSLAYNIGIGAFGRSTVLRKHKAGDYAGAARAFIMWNKNDGKVMRGLTRRRLAESDLYDD